jgi:transcriptional regulator with XRE-family HTH domain
MDDQTKCAAFAKGRESLGLSQQDIADLAGIDVALVEQYEKGELTNDQMVAHDKIIGAMLKVIAKRDPEKLEAAVRPVSELAKTYPEGSVMRHFLNHAENMKKFLLS